MEANEIDALKAENAALRKELEKAKFFAEMYREEAYKRFNELHPYIPPTEAELQDMLHGPRGPSILEIVEEYEQKYLRVQE